MGLTEQSVEILKELVAFGLTHNLRFVSCGQHEIEFFSEPKPAQLPTPTVTAEPEERGPSEDELLFYSTDTFDQLREERENAKD